METNNAPTGFKEGELTVAMARPGSGHNSGLAQEAALRAVMTPHEHTAHMQVVMKETKSMPPESVVPHISAAAHAIYRDDSRSPYQRGREESMNLPEGKTCGDCVHIHRCFHMFGHAAYDEICDWAPSRFQDLATLYGPRTNTPTSPEAPAN